MVIVVY